MKNKKDMNVTQNRFSAYLAVSVSNRRIKYLMERNRKQRAGYTASDLQKNRNSCIYYEMKFRSCLKEKPTAALNCMELAAMIMSLLENDILAEGISGLKEKEQMILFVRIFGELSFLEIGELIDTSGKQAEMKYYYIIRKLRKNAEEEKWSLKY